MAIPKARNSQHQLGGFQEKIVKVKDIVEKERLIYVVDEHKTQYMVPLNTVSGTYRLPRVGEIWYMSKAMGQWQLKHMIAEDIRNQYYHYYKVEVESIEDRVANVVTTEEKNEKRFKIDMDIRRYKSHHEAEIGDAWIIDNALGKYTFAAYLGSVSGPPTPPPPPVTSVNGQTGDVVIEFEEVDVSWSNLIGKPEIFPGQLVLSVNNHSSSQSVSGSLSAVNWSNSLIRDPYGMWSSSNPSRITPQIPGYYQFITTIAFPGNSGGIRNTSIRFNGGATRSGDAVAHGAGSEVVTLTSFARSVSFNGVSDYIQIFASTTGTTGLSFPNGVNASVLEAFYVGAL